MKKLGFWIYDTLQFLFQSKGKSTQVYPQRIYTVHTDVLFVSVIWTVVFTLWAGSLYLLWH